MVAHNLTWSVSRAPRNSHCNRHNSQRIHFFARFYILDVDINQVVFFSIDFWSKKMTSGLPPSISQRVCRWLLRVFHSSTTRRSSCRITGNAPPPSSLTEFRPPGFCTLVSSTFSLEKSSTSCEIIMIMLSNWKIVEGSPQLYCHSSITTQPSSNPLKLQHYIEVMRSNDTGVLDRWIDL